ncbi:F5/8 type C domain-containing protein [Myxococcus virescens]|uniref:F5/8 type C domain-containing protein n=4 Tax=Myxococcus virescens TaxID=83456 RepID=A0ABY0N1V8_9BACT|nr:discoidin domain-containing protein [Myxococcus virescens]SDE85400.1 F5/8 type C domain-containing protein [Myxococcus virescens]
MHLREPARVLALTALALATPTLAAEGFISVTASGDDGNVPANAIDGDPTTRWSSDGVGEWLTGDLGAVKSLSAVDISWHRGDERVNRFVISTSTDGTNFTQVHSGSSSGTTAAPERYSFSAVNARYVRITVNGSTMNTWASIAELAAVTDGSPPPTDPPGVLPERFTSVAASGDDGNVPANAIDGDPATRWSSDGVGQWITGDLGTVAQLSAVDIGWHRGNERINNFVISTSTDGTNFTQVHSGRSSGTTAELERYSFSAVNTRYVRITVNGSSMNTWASIAEMQPGTGSTPPTAPPERFTSVAASGDDGNVPANAIDGDPATRWSSDGVGQWITGDLGTVAQLSAVDIGWHRGNERVNNFVISTSTDGTNFAQVHSGRSSGTTSALERYSFSPVSTRYVRITVNGSSMNTWASIAEMQPGTGSTPPIDPPGEQGQDKFGVTMIYPTKSGGEQWFLADNATSDKRFDPQNTISRNSDGSWKMKNSKVRMSVFTSTGYSASKIPTYDRDVLASRGYMQAANDWRNIEMTGFVKVNSVSDVSDNFAWYARGGKHNDNHSGCEGSSYKGSLHYDGRVRWQKETWHVSYNQAAYKSGTSALRGRWVGFKSVMRNTKVNGKEAVRLEMYLNENADKKTWKKVYDMVDSGSWGGDASHCGGAVNAMPITWGGPIAVFRWDSANDVDFKWLSVREISPEQ